MNLVMTSATTTTKAKVTLIRKPVLIRWESLSAVCFHCVTCTLRAFQHAAAEKSPGL
jgi:hypothetical protein